MQQHKPLHFELEPISLNGQIKARIRVTNDDGLIDLDTIRLDSHLCRKRFAERIANASKVSVEEIMDELLRLSEEQTSQALNPPQKSEQDVLSTMPENVITEARSILASSNLFQDISADIETMGVTGERELALMLYIIMTSRQLEKPLSAIVQGASSSGKSYVIKTVANLIPPEVIIHAHDFTEQAFYYLPAGSLKHKIIVSGEREHEFANKEGQAEQSNKAFREMVSDGELRKCVTVKGDKGQLETKTIIQPGPIAYLESTTATTIYDEDATRLLPLISDESPEQTRRIIAAMQNQAQGIGPTEKDRAAVIQKHWAMQRLLQPIEVLIPYSHSLHFPSSKIAVRRSYGFLLATIKTVAFMRQFQKEKQKSSEGTDFIAADEMDYTVAYDLIKPILTRTFSSLPDKCLKLFSTIEGETHGESHVTQQSYRQFTLLDATDWSQCSESETRRRLKPLVNCGALSLDMSQRPYRYCLAQHDLSNALMNQVNLPDPESIAERIAIMKEEKD
jgi:uridine kinase